MIPAPPFPAELSPARAVRQALALLALFYAVVYGGSWLLAPLAAHRLAPVLSALAIAAIMLLAVAALVRRDVHVGASLAVAAPRLRATIGWSLVGFVTTYAVNIALTLTYVSFRGGLAAVAERRAVCMTALADLPVELVLPLAAFAGLWEEVVFRGFLLGRLRAALSMTGLGPGWREALAVALTALCFGAGHGYQGGLGLLQTTAAGLVLGALTLLRGSLWPAVGAHLAIDAFGLAAVRALKSLA